MCFGHSFGIIISFHLFFVICLLYVQKLTRKTTQSDSGRKIKFYCLALFWVEIKYLTKKKLQQKNVFDLTHGRVQKKGGGARGILNK